jgi:peptide/nickel transport system permease protein
MSTSFVVRRVVHGLVVVLCVSVLVFFVARVFTDPVAKSLPLEASREEYLRLRHLYGLDKPLLVQFREFFGDLLQLDFGESLWQSRAAGPIVLERLPATLVLVVASITLAVVIGIPLGVIAALRPGSPLDRSAMVISTAGLSMPQFWLGSLLILAVSVRLKWLPTSGNDGFRYLILPALTMGLPIAGRVTQIVRSTIIDQFNERYALVARAKGFSVSYVIRHHFLRNAGSEITTLVSLEFVAALATYSIMVETVFAWPGLGLLTVEALQRSDVFLLQAIVFVVAVIVIVTNLLADVINRCIDPRTRRSYR